MVALCKLSLILYTGSGIRLHRLPEALAVTFLSITLAHMMHTFCTYTRNNRILKRDTYIHTYMHTYIQMCYTIYLPRGKALEYTGLGATYYRHLNLSHACSDSHAMHTCVYLVVRHLSILG